jgi:glycosyltransferase involved in cell wall biosynthesis
VGTAEKLMKNIYNILYLANSGNIIGGGQISIKTLLEGLDEKKYHPLVVCPTNGNLVDELNKLGIETTIIKMESLRKLNVLSWVNTIFKLIRLIKRRNFDLIHSNGSRPTIYGGIAARITKTPLIWHVRIADTDKWVDKVLARFATKILVVSKAVSLRFKWNKKKITVVYNGIDLEKFNPLIDGTKIRQEFSLLSSTPLVGIVGRLDNYKGHEYFIKAAKKVIDAIPNTRFLIVGDGENRKKLESLKMKLGLNGHVIFTGNRDDIAEIMAALDLFVLSSVSEGFGRSAVEAMACGKAVVASNVGGLSEVVEDGVTGKLIPSKNPDSLTMAILSLLEDNEKTRRMGHAGRQRAEKMFSLRENIMKTVRIYEQVISNQEELKT